ncbi:histidine kinase [uncultured Winogradskyella sp.]|uniref:histidine kinase n=1 Tax=uncultured Winogradskyella sp. TaxID=395353 RepID=UPI002636CD67|nr:histidine kinase [uncultured Winogradskyella sp.]
MKAIHKLVLTLLIFLIGCLGYGQNRQTDNGFENRVFTIRGSVYEKDTSDPISEVNIQINGSKYTTTDFNGKFTIEARVGDELMVTHNSFDPVYYTIKNNERIYIEVLPSDSYSQNRFKSISNKKAFNRLIDSADSYLKTDAAKSIKFIGDALDVNNSTSESAEAHELLGDVYMFWKQYDLAISAYKISLQNVSRNAAQLKLAKAYLLNNNVSKSIKVYNTLKVSKLSNYDKTLYYEGLGDAYVKTKDYQQATDTYNKGLKIAKKHLITPKITDLNSKIAQAYNEKGEKRKAKNYFKNSLNLAQQENKKRAVEEKVKVAEFNSSNRDYDDEIELRKQALEDIKEIERDSEIPNESALTLQKQSYKLGNAYLLNNDLDNAIPSYKNSIKEANKKGDLVVGKDATRKLSEAFFKKGDTDKGLAMIENYENLVDELYLKKEQEISQVARFSRNLAEQQNRITSLESDRALSRSKYELTQERNKSQQVIIYSLIGGLVLLLITGFLMYKYIKQQRLANNLLALKSLRSQMNPHFIFNALNSVNSFIATNDERTANKYLSDFSHLMRAVLENSEEDFIPLKKEIELIDLYTKLEHFRFKDKFNYTIEVDDDIDLEEFQIPPMLLQPYVENSVWHGLRYKTNKGQLYIAVYQNKKDEISISITDDGIGRKRSKALKTEHQKKQNSKGMNNIKKRVAILNDMYKDKVAITIEDFQNLEDAGTKVVVTLKKD